MKKILNYLSSVLLRMYKRFFLKKSYSVIQIKLKKLHPQERKDEIFEQYQKRKIITITVVIVIGLVSAVCSVLCSRNESRLAEGNRLIRKQAGSGDYSITLQAKTDEWERGIVFQVDEKQLTADERNQLLYEVQNKLPDIIKGQNQDLQHVNANLNLVTNLNDYPFRISWKSSNNHKLSSYGEVNNRDIPKEGEEVVLTAILSDGIDTAQMDYSIRLIPKDNSMEDWFFSEVEKKLMTENNNKKTNSQIILPQNILGKDIMWTEKRSSPIGWIILFTIGGALAVCIGMRRDLDKNLYKRNRQICRDYPECVSKLRLYLSAGLTIKKTLFKMAQEYRNRDNREKRFLYEEMLITCSQLENGVMEEKAYVDWGKRCDEMKVRRLGFLLSVYVKKGNADLLEMLALEAQGAQDDQRNQARKFGEEAGTKLLLPMMMMLIIVMFLILLPAWLGFGQI